MVVVVPTPVRLTVWPLLLALSVIDKAPVSVPVAEGVNVTEMVHCAPVAKDEPQLLLWEKSPLTTTPLILQARITGVRECDRLSCTHRAQRLVGKRDRGGRKFPAGESELAAGESELAAFGVPAPLAPPPQLKLNRAAMRTRTTAYFVWARADGLHKTHLESVAASCILRGNDNLHAGLR